MKTLPKYSKVQLSGLNLNGCGSLEFMPGLMNPLQPSSIALLIGTVLGKKVGCLPNPVRIRCLIQLCDNNDTNRSNGSESYLKFAFITSA